MTETAFDPNWQWGHVTRDGRKARVICTDADCTHLGEPQPVVALVDQAVAPFTYTLDGWFHSDKIASPCDLLNAPPPKRKVKVDLWVNVYDGDKPGVHESRNVADRASRNSDGTFGRDGLIHIIGEIEEGSEITLTIPQGGGE